MLMPVTVDWDFSGDSVIAKVEAEALDTDNVGSFRAAIGAVLERSNNVVLDLSKLEYMDSTGLGSMLSCLRMMKAKGGHLRLAGLTPEVKRLFDMVMMDRVFEIFPDA